MGTAAQFGGMGMKAGGAYTSAMAQQGANRANAQIAEYQAGQAIQNGQTNVGNSRLRVAQVKGEQRAAMAANGVDLGEGSATDVLASTDLLGDRDAATIMDNALRTAWGYQVQEAQYKNANENIHPGLDFFSSLFGSATSTQGQQSFSNLGQSMGGSSAASSGGGGMTAWAGADSGAAMEGMA
jgi:hypothetical protein